MYKFTVCLLALWLLSACAQESRQVSATTSSSVKATENKTEATLAQASNNKVTSMQQSNMIKQKLAWLTGTVQYLNMEGGFFGIVTDDGQRILPMNLPKQFRTPGTVIRFKGLAQNINTIQQWGTPFKITEVELISQGKGAPVGDQL